MHIFLSMRFIYHRQFSSPMNNHFLLKLPDRLTHDLRKDINNENFTNIEIYTKDTSTVFKYKGIEYSTIYYNLPCVIEIHKTMDKKQFFKVSDVSNCLYVIENTGHKHTEPLLRPEKIKKEMANITSHSITDPNLAKKILEMSGISPSLNLAKLRRFRKKTKKTTEVELRELKVRELIEKEKRASSVQIIFSKEEEEDISSFAAEIENSLIQEDKSEVNQDMIAKLKIIEDLNEKIRIKKEQIEATGNVIVKKRFTETLEKLEEEVERINKEIADLETIKKSL